MQKISVPLNEEKVSVFEDTQKNLLLLSDANTGIMALFHEEHLLSMRDQPANSHFGREVNKFLVSVIPRVLLVPSISEEIGPLLDHALVKSPAQQVLSSSTYFLVTLHEDNRIRLWNTNDGRMIMVSSKDLFVTKVIKIQRIKKHPGHILAMGNDGNFYIINCYIMSMVKHQQYDFYGVVGSVFKKKQFALCDQRGKVFVWTDDSGNSPIRNMENIERTTLLLEMCNNEDQEIFQFQLIKEQGIEQVENNKILTFYYGNQDMAIVVGSKQINLLLNNESIKLYEFENDAIFAHFINKSEREMLLVIDQELNLILFDLVKLKIQAATHSPLLIIDMKKKTKFFDVVNTKDMSSLLYDLQERREEVVQQFVKCVQSELAKGHQVFKYNSKEHILYSILDPKNDGQSSKMISWSLECLIDNLSNVRKIEDPILPLFSNSIHLFQKQHTNCLVNFNSLIIRNFYNKNQFQFFFSDEEITNSVVYTSIDHPSLVIGTNYGRIFIMSMFQEVEEKVFPIALVDAHHQSPINQLFICYNSSRKCRAYQRYLKQGGSQPPKNQMDNGAHLISCSEDGTICVTNLNSGDMHTQLHNFSINDRERRKADTFMNEKNQNQRNRRRHSIHHHFSVNHYFNLVKVRPARVFSYASFGQIVKVLEVKTFADLMERDSLRPAMRERKFHSHHDRRREESASPTRFQRQNSQSGFGSKSQNFEPGQEYNTVPYYACIGEDGIVYVISITSLRIELTKYQALDSPTIGVYLDEEFQLMHFLTEKLNFYSFNKKSKLLERKGDFNFAMQTLCIREIVEHLKTKNDSFKMYSRDDCNVFDFFSFEKIFKNKNLLMGLGSHKTLDYLSVSLTMPLNYHPHTIYTDKYSKILHDLLIMKAQINDFNKSEQNQKDILRQINKSFFLNNILYKSDFNDYYFEESSGVTCMETKNTFCSSKQQMLIINTKQMINVMKKKMNKVMSNSDKSNKKGARPELSKFNQHGGDIEHVLTEEEKAPMDNITMQRISMISQSIGFKSYNQKVEVDHLSKIQWPTRLLSLMHPFNIDEQVDTVLEQFFGLNLPFLDFRVGVQGADESFSFVISKEDEDFFLDRNNIQKLIRLLKLSKKKKDQECEYESPRHGGGLIQPLERQESTLDQINNMEDVYPLGRFFNSEYWKISSYLSTVIPCLFLSTFVSIVEYSENDVKFLLQEWLFTLQRINQLKTISGSNQISMSVISKVLLKKDHNISSTARDVIMKPILYTLDVGNLKMLMDEWQQIIMDTYKKLRRDSNVKKNYGQHSQQQREIPSSNFGGSSRVIGGQLGQTQSSQQQISRESEVQQINHYFGELEIRGLINISYFTLYYSQHVDTNIQYRVSKITTILTREIVQKFNKDKKYIHLLTILLQLLSTWMKTQSLNQKSKIIIDQVIKLLLILFNDYKSPLNKEQFITRITADNFHLIRPTHSELYLKLTAAKALLEIGENFTHDFLMIIQDQATNLNEGNEYQQNVLEILRYFINGYGENLEHHLIQLTQILLKCLDPNELALRKNSHKLISVILSIMVKIFPMVAFHHESQRLAVGTHDGPIAIYDVRTSAKWKILEGHTGNVTCLAFDSKGNLLASYSSVDLTVRLWKVGNTGFFSTIMGGTGKCSREIKLPQLNVKNPHQIIQQQRLQHQKSNVIGGNSLPEQEASKTGHDGTRINKCSIHFLNNKEKEVVLTRENLIKQEIKLVK